MIGSVHTLCSGFSTTQKVEHGLIPRKDIPLVVPAEKVG